MNNEWIKASKKQQKSYLKDDLIPITLEFRHHDELIIKSNQSMIEEIINYQNKKIVVIHYNDVNDELWQNTTLYPCIEDIELKDQFIYTPNIMVDHNNELYQMNVITSNHYQLDDEQIRRILDIARANYNEIIIIKTNHDYKLFEEYKQYFDMIIIHG